VLKFHLNSQVDVLMIEKNNSFSYQLDNFNSEKQESTLNRSAKNKGLEYMIYAAFKLGTKVYILEQNLMPTSTGISALYRFK
jgi:hypothetical protein